jgi:hypothetical protein
MMPLMSHEATIEQLVLRFREIEVCSADCPGCGERPSHLLFGVRAGVSDELEIYYCNTCDRFVT